MACSDSPIDQNTIEIASPCMYPPLVVTCKYLLIVLIIIPCKVRQSKILINPIPIPAISPVVSLKILILTVNQIT